jgi:hypothetical protein
MDNRHAFALAAGTGGALWIAHATSVAHARDVRARLQAPPTSPPSPAPATLSNASRPGPAPNMTPIRRTFDRLFAQHAQGIPVAFLRALAQSESGLNPRATNRVATGLFQLLSVVRDDHNKLHGTAYTRDDLLDPTVNTIIAVAALRRIARSYAKNHPHTPNLLTDWNNYRFAELLTFGWNKGWSERAGVGRVATYLEQRGIHDVTIELVHQHARAAGASHHLENAKAVQWAKGVVQRYTAERTRDVIEHPHQPHELEMPPMVFESAPALVVMDDAAPISMPSQVDPSPVPPAMGATAPPAAVTAMVPIDPYATSPLLDPYPTT